MGLISGITHQENPPMLPQCHLNRSECEIHPPQGDSQSSEQLLSSCGMHWVSLFILHEDVLVLVVLLLFLLALLRGLSRPWGFYSQFHQQDRPKLLWADVWVTWLHQLLNVDLYEISFSHREIVLFFFLSLFIFSILSTLTEVRFLKTKPII